jgi:hypothetical protein
MAKKKAKTKPAKKMSTSKPDVNQIGAQVVKEPLGDQDY